MDNNNIICLIATGIFASFFIYSNESKESKSNKKCSILHSKNHKLKKTCSDLNNLKFSNSFLLDKFNIFCNLFDTKYLTVHSKNNLLNSVTWKIPLDILNKSYLNYFNNFDYIKIDNINNQLIIGKFITINPSILKIVKNISSSIHVSRKSFHNLDENMYLIKVSTDNITKAALTLYYIQNLNSNSDNIDLSIDNIQISYKKLIKDFLENKSNINIEWFDPEEFQEKINKNIITLNINNLSDLHTNEINTGSKTSEKLVLSLDTDNTTNDTTENSDETDNNQNLNDYLDEILESPLSNNSVIVESEIDIIAPDKIENKMIEEKDNESVEEQVLEEFIEDVNNKETIENIVKNDIRDVVESIIEDIVHDDVEHVIEKEDDVEDVIEDEDVKCVVEVVKHESEDELKKIISKNCMYLKENSDYDINKIINNLLQDIETSNYDDLVLLMELTNDMIKSLNIDVSIISDSDLEDSDLEDNDLELVFEENNDLINRLFNR